MVGGWVVSFCYDNWSTLFACRDYIGGAGIRDSLSCWRSLWILGEEEGKEGPERLKMLSHCPKWFFFECVVLLTMSCYILCLAPWGWFDCHLES